MSSKGSPLKFQLVITPVQPQPCKGIIQTGEKFNLDLKIISNKGSFNHRGIEFEFATEFTPKSGKTLKYCSNTLRIAEAGTITGSQEFNLPQCEIPVNCQTYVGESFSLRHWVRITVKKLIGSVDYEKEIRSYNVMHPSKKFDPICVRVAVSDAIRIDLIISRRQFEVGDVITGAAHFLLINLKVKSFTITFMAQEYTEANGRTIKNKHKIGTWEISDGAPVKGEIIPFRLFLDPLKLDPSCANPQKGYSVTHLLRFTVLTMSDERYFKDLQIKLNKWPELPFVFTDTPQEQE
ncbi:Vacuolar protein sorting-associated protein 26A [Tritrichomonas foetus]|uniref:Vacuolar protein sorting-associated protein 26A n=1 Tax=Tritrichomonas foetus TaxID=1144522 RepID=A0A1J4K667_9EUKA|nr:Vacuolar protein sorting-associated protein 26A [Tritrichomonas foetus]|eukprot:OHT06911.1 Vacuolar protein sorting-associated protein 26A [Tritrichomonas foetus]